MNKALIEKLKERKLAQPFKLLSDEERGILETAGPSQCLILCESGTWQDKRKGPYSLCYAYILKPDYKPEPEYADIEVVVGKNGEVSLERPYRDRQAKFLWWATANKEFRGFFYDDAGIPCRISMDRVAEYVAQGHKVYARFVKEGYSDENSLWT